MICRTHKSTLPTSSSRPSWRSRVWAFNYLSAPYLLYPWKDCHKSLVWSLAHWNDVHNSWLNMLATRSPLKVTSLNLFFSCPFLISFTPGRIFIDLYSNVHLSETVCKTYVSAMPTQGQGHSWRRQLTFRLPFCLKENWQQTSQRNTVQSSRLGSQRKCQKHPFPGVDIWQSTHVFIELLNFYCPYGKNRNDLKETWKESFLGDQASIVYFDLCVCVELLRPSQLSGVMSSAVSLPNPTFTG